MAIEVKKIRKQETMKIQDSVGRHIILLLIWEDGENLTGWEIYPHDGHGKGSFVFVNSDPIVVERIGHLLVKAADILKHAGAWAKDNKKDDPEDE